MYIWWFFLFFKYTCPNDFQSTFSTYLLPRRSSIVMNSESFEKKYNYLLNTKIEKKLDDKYYKRSRYHKVFQQMGLYNTKEIKYNNKKKTHKARDNLPDQYCMFHYFRFR